MRQDERAPFDDVLTRARNRAYPPGEYVGQESFMRAGDIRRVASRAGIARDTSVVDLCCGVAGPGRLIVAETGCDYLGIDYSDSALQIARERTAGLPCRFRLGRIPPVPVVDADVVLLLSTMLAFRDKATLLGQIAQILHPGGRFACTVEVGAPLDAEERMRMPDADTVWLIDPNALAAALRQAGLTETWRQDSSSSQREIAASLLRAFRDDAAHISRGIGHPALSDLLEAHRLWVGWLGSGRVRMLELVVQKQ